MRTKRTDGNTTYEYVYNGDKLSQMTVGDYTLTFGYDASGAPMYVQWNGIRSYYVTNIQGDVVAIVSENGIPVVEYTYDAWGNILSITGTRADNLGRLNPLRYRGYVYDVETGLYYLQSRYYNPEMGRFLNADDVSLLGANGDFASLNLYAYCGNNPVVRADDGGGFWNTIIGAVAGAIVGGVSPALSGSDITAGIVSGALSGAISGAAVDIAIATGGVGLVALAGVAIASGAGSAAGSYVNQRMNGISHDKVDWRTVAIDGIWGVVGGMLSFGAADVGGEACKTLAENLALKSNAFWGQAGSDFATTLTIASGTWLNGTRMNLLMEGKAAIAPLY